MQQKSQGIIYNENTFKSSKQLAFVPSNHQATFSLSSQGDSSDGQSVTRYLGRLYNYYEQLLQIPRTEINLVSLNLWSNYKHSSVVQ